MNRLFNLTLTVLFLLSVCLTSSATAELKSAGGECKRNKNVYGYVYISVIPYSIWYADGTHAYTMTDHSFDTYNFSDTAVDYDYEFKQYLAQYDIVRKQAGNLINEAKEIGFGGLAAYDAENHNWPDYHADKSTFQYHYLPEFNLTEGKWYEVGGYTRLSILGRKGKDSWQVESDELHFQWWEPDN